MDEKTMVNIPFIEDNTNTTTTTNNNNEKNKNKKISNDNNSDKSIITTSDNKSILSLKVIKEKILNVASIRRTSQTIMLVVILITICEYKPLMEKIINHVIKEHPHCDTNTTTSII